jgi:hypothetical protein
MYFPPYDQLLRTAGLSRATVDGTKEVTIPRKLFEFLLQAALATADFDEASYLAANPDVREQSERGAELSPTQHFVGYGYFEGRKGGLPKVDERWYLRTYPDVAAAVAGGKVASAAQHFEMTGAGEGRAPSREYLDVANQWKALFSDPKE